MSWNPESVVCSTRIVGGAAKRVNARPGFPAETRFVAPAASGKSVSRSIPDQSSVSLGGASALNAVRFLLQLLPLFYLHLVFEFVTHELFHALGHVVVRVERSRAP
jgi:hypothetical protein